MSFIITPATGVAVTLRNPDEGNIERVTLNDIRRFSRGGTIWQGKDDTHWAQLKTHVYKFSALTSTVITALRTLLKNNAGRQITVKDDADTAMSGFIFTPINEIIAERPLCTYDVSFEFIEVSL